jgi:hypothetical protein
MKFGWLDNMLVGFLVGILAPSIVIYFFYLFNFSTSSLDVFLNLAVKQKLLSPLLALCCVANLGLFFSFLHFDKLFASRGIILATFLYGFIIVLLKFFM